jgi:hypothetical protein
MATEQDTGASFVAPFVSKAASAATYGGGFTAFVGGLTANEIAAYGGLLVAVLAYVTNTVMTFYFRWQHLKLERERGPAPDSNG